MKTSELKAKPIAELMTLRSRITRLIATKQVQANAARKRILAIAKRCGVSLRDLGLKTGRGPDKAPRKARTVKAAKGVRGTGTFARKANGSAESRVTH